MYLLFYGGAVLWVSIPWQAYMLLRLPWKVASNTQLQSWPLQKVTWQSGKQRTQLSSLTCLSLDCSGVEGSSSISSQGHWTMEAIMYWVVWDIYEWCLLFHGGAVLRGGRKPIAELPNVAVQTAWWLPSSTSGSMTGPQWNRRSFFHFHHWVIWTDEAWGMNLGYMGNLWIIFAISLRSWEVWGTFIRGFATSSRSSTECNLPPGVAQYDLDHCQVGDYNLGSCGTSMSDICYFFAEQYWETWGNFWKRSVSLLLGVLFVFGFCLLCFALFGFCFGFVTLGYGLTFWKRQSK